VEAVHAAFKGDCTWMKIQISLEGAEHMDVTASGQEPDTEASFASAAASLEASVPAYLLIADGDQWAAALYVPPTCKPKQKMVYSSSLAGLFQSLHLSPATTLQGSVPDDFTYATYKGRMDLTATAASSMTAEERLEKETAREMALAKAEQLAGSGAPSHVGTAFAAGQGFGFPLQPDAEAALRRMAAEEQVVRLVLRIPKEEEVIALDSLCDSGGPVDGLDEVGDAEPAFFFLRFDSHIVFVYCCPATCKVKRKMIYSSARNALLGIAETQCMLKPAFRQEVGSVTEVTATSLQTLVAPPAAVGQPEVIARPKGKARSRPPRGS